MLHVKPPAKFYSIELFLIKIWTFMNVLFKNQFKKYKQHQAVKYVSIPLSIALEKRLLQSSKKILVLDLDETLVNTNWLSHRSARPLLKPDFILKIEKDHHPIRFYVYKRPHVDYFLETVSKWYDIVIYTASKESYGLAVLDMLDNGRCILNNRLYRQHCTYEAGIYKKDLSIISNDPSKILIIDNSPESYMDFPHNAIAIKSWNFNESSDTELLTMLPFLDALRFCQDVRSVLARNLHNNCKFVNKTCL